MKQNKNTKYFKYALGEIILVVIGILIALQINNWNEERKIENKKQQLVLNLIEDFEENKILLEAAIHYSDSLNLKMDSFFENAYLNNPTISLDSIKKLSGSFFRPVYFFPLTATYDEAKASGNITLLNNKELSQNFSAFQMSFNIYQGIQNQGRESFFNGATWELKKSIGSINYLTGRKNTYANKNLNLTEYKKLIKMPLVMASLENQLVLMRNVNSNLKRMKGNADKILEKLKEIKK